MATDYQFPRDFGPLKLKALWLQLSPLKINSELGKAVQSANPTVPPAHPDNSAPSFRLLLPDSIQMVVNHSYEEYESYTAKLADTISKYYKNVYKVGGATTNVAGALKEYFSKGSYLSGLQELGTALAKSEPVVYTRIDSPRIYKTSTPVEYNLTFDLAPYAPSDGPYLKRLIRDMMAYYSPTRGSFSGSEAVAEGLGIFIDPPRLWKVSMVGNMDDVPILNLQYAAIEQIQPEYIGPFINGSPKKVSLVLNIKDVTPLLNKTFMSGTSVSVSA